MRFDFAWFWLILPPVLGCFFWLARRSYAHLTPVARWSSLILRCIIFICLIGALSRPAMRLHANRKHVVLALDVSRSNSQDNLEAALTEIDALARSAVDQNANISLIAFGRRPELLIRSQSSWSGLLPEMREKLLYESSLAKLYGERTSLVSAQKDDDAKALDVLQERIVAIERFRDDVAGDYTDGEQALRLALNCGSNAEQRTIYVFTDGQFNRGRWQDAWSAVDDSALIHAVKLDKPMPPEVAIADVSLPPSVRVNQGFSADVRVISTVATPAKLVVFRDGVSSYEADIEIKPGENIVRAPGMYFREKGFHAIEAAVRPQQDTQLKNNSNRSTIVVPGEARVLYVDSNESQMAYLKSALELEGMQVDARPATGVPSTMAELLSFDAFILSDVPADRLSFQQMQMIRTYVQEFGGGFIMLGGTESFGLGGYYNTPVEEILPVKMPIQKELNRPSLALVLVIDKSGSMSGVKIELAKRASIATADAINPRDLIGLIGFDSEARVLLELTPAADRETIGSNIANLEAGGGTFLYPGLELAHDRLAQSNARRKHVIVLSDGQTQGFGYVERVETMSADGITLSTIGIGGDVDVKLLEAIASSGGGRAYFTNDFYSIPQIFTREALRASNSMLIERLVQPAVIEMDACLKDIDPDEIPLLAGYVATTPRTNADTIMASDSGDPLLAKWRYGLGRTAAFTSEAKPRWAEDWIAWEDFAKFWSQLIRSITGENLARTVSVECGHALEGNGVRLWADLRDATGGFVTDAKVELSTPTENGRTRNLPVEHVGPGLYDARLPELEFGRDQQFVWRVTVGEKEHAPVSYGFVHSFSPEFQTLGVNADVFERMTTTGKGQVMSVGTCGLSLSTNSAASWLVIWPHLLIAALLLVPLDILIRRLG